MHMFSVPVAAKRLPSIKPENVRFGFLPVFFRSKRLSLPHLWFVRAFCLPQISTVWIALPSTSWLWSVSGFNRLSYQANRNNMLVFKIPSVIDHYQQVCVFQPFSRFCLAWQCISRITPAVLAANAHDAQSLAWQLLSYELAIVPAVVTLLDFCFWSCGQILCFPEEGGA